MLHSNTLQKNISAAQRTITRQKRTADGRGQKTTRGIKTNLVVVAHQLPNTCLVLLLFCLGRGQWFVTLLSRALESPEPLSLCVPAVCCLAREIKRDVNNTGEVSFPLWGWLTGKIIPPIPFLTNLWVFIQLFLTVALYQPCITCYCHSTFSPSKNSGNFFCWHSYARTACNMLTSPEIKAKRERLKTKCMMAKLEGQPLPG